MFCELFSESAFCNHDSLMSNEITITTLAYCDKSSMYNILAYFTEKETEALMWAVMILCDTTLFFYTE